jgi:hypothetical protein
MERTRSTEQFNNSATEMQDGGIKFVEDVYDADEIIRLFEAGRFDIAIAKFEGSPKLNEIAKNYVGGQHAA